MQDLLKKYGTILAFLGLGSFEAWRSIYSSHIDDRIRDRHVQELLDKVINEELLEKQEAFNNMVEARFRNVSDSIRFNRKQMKSNREYLKQVDEAEESTYQKLKRLSIFNEHWGYTWQE